MPAIAVSPLQLLALNDVLLVREGEDADFSQTCAGLDQVKAENDALEASAGRVRR
jgi:hypothetical protein